MYSFTSLLTSLVSYAGKLIIVGDFNIHMDVAANFDSIKLRDTLEMFNLRQFVSHSTHQNGPGFN